MSNKQIKRSILMADNENTKETTSDKLKKTDFTESYVHKSPPATSEPPTTRTTSKDSPAQPQTQKVEKTEQDK